MCFVNIVANSKHFAKPFKPLYLGAQVECLKKGSNISWHCPFRVYMICFLGFSFCLNCFVLFKYYPKAYCPLSKHFSAHCCGLSLQFTSITQFVHYSPYQQNALLDSIYIEGVTPIYQLNTTHTVLIFWIFLAYLIIFSLYCLYIRIFVC